MKRDGSPEGIIEILKASTATITKWSPELEIPDLVTLIGREITDQFIRYALKFPAVQLSVPGGGETLAIAKNIVIEEVASLKAPQWALTQDMDSIELYEALEKRFGIPPDAGSGGAIDQDILKLMQASSSGSFDWEHDKARWYYLFSLIAAGRHEDAIATSQWYGMTESQSFPKQALYQLHQAGYSAQVLSFLRNTLSSDPSLNLWSVYIKIANFNGDGDSVIELLSSVLENSAISGMKRTKLQLRHAEALLAADQVNEAINAFVDIAPRLSDEEAFKVGLNITRAGLLLDHTVWLNDGSSLALEGLEKGFKTGEYWTGDGARTIAGLLHESGQSERAEKLLFKRISDAVVDNDMGVLTMNRVLALPYLVELFRIYHDTGRNEDIVTLLDEYALWNSIDLAKIIEIEDSRNYPLGYYAAFALAETGQGDSALKISKAIIRAKPGFDPAYELLIDLENEQSLPFLEDLYLRDQFEERPLIWKAIAQSLAGNYSAAKATVERAISIDPSDGEQGRNHRMRAYSVLANILDAQGDAEGAQTYRGAVQAIRLSEYADRLLEAGLNTAAINSYNEATKLFSDAYCIQSRLAIQLTEQGRHSTAAQHFRKAYELMPDSFGRVESHCFGCENVFAYPGATSIAENVFSAMLESRPDDPQVHYMMGYLRLQQDRYQEALTQFRTAVALDPEYLNAWKQLNELGNKTFVAGWEREIAIMKMLELDPLQQHVQPDLENVLDIKSLYTALARAKSLEFQINTTESLYILYASEQNLHEQLQNIPAQQRRIVEIQLEAINSHGYARYQSSGLAATSIIGAAMVLVGGF